MAPVTPSATETINHAQNLANPQPSVRSRPPVTLASSWAMIASSSRSVSKEGSSAFYGPMRTDGLTLLASRENVAKAFGAAKGNVLAFAQGLYQLEGQQRDTIETEAAEL